MNDQHKMELLKALREHGQTISKFADGGTTLAGPGVTSSSGSTVAPRPGDALTTSEGGKNSLVANQWLNPGNAAIGSFANDVEGMTQNNFQATGANLQAGTNAAQLNDAYSNAQTGLGAQGNFLNALQAQNGIQNQSNVYNQMQGVANGQGPNPALAMLNQQTGQNVSNQAALMAGQRGAGANAGLLARQAAQQGAQTQQNAIGQGASLQANQSLNALNNMGTIAQNQVNQQGQATTGFNTAAQNEQNILQGANSAFNTANVGMQSNLNNVNAQISQGNQSAQNGLMGGMMNGGATALSSLYKGGEVKRMADGGDVDFGSESYTAPAATGAPSIGSVGSSPDEGAGFKSSGGGGGGGGGGGIAGLMALLADGGPVSKPQPYNIQSPTMTMPMQNTIIQQGGPKSNTGKYLKGAGSVGANIGSMGSGNVGAQALYNGASGMASSAVGALGKMGSTSGPGSGAGGGPSGDDTPSVGSMQTPSNYTNQDAVDKAIPFDRGGGVGDRLKGGGKVPGKPKVGGQVNTVKNDNVPALLSAGEVVLPRSVTQSADPVNGAAKFMAALMKKKGQNPKKAS